MPSVAFPLETAVAGYLRFVTMSSLPGPIPDGYSVHMGAPIEDLRARMRAQRLRAEIAAHQGLN